MDESIILLSSMSPKIRQKRCRKGVSLLALKSNIRNSSIYKPPAQNYNDVSLVEESTQSSSSYKSEKPIVVNAEPIIITDTSESEESMKEPVVPSEKFENCAHLLETGKPDKEDYIKKWIEDVAIETTFKESSVFTEMSTIHGIDSEFLPKEKGNAVNSTFANRIEKRLDELFENKQKMGALAVNDSFETQNSLRIAGNKSILTNSSDAKLIINDSFEQNEVRNAKGTSILTNDDSDLSYKRLSLCKSDNIENTRKSILTNDDTNLSLQKNIIGKVCCNSILTNDESNSSNKPIVDNCLQNVDQKKSKSSVNSFNTENTPPVLNSPCTPQANFNKNSHSNFQKHRKQNMNNDLSSDTSSGDESGIESENNVKDAEKVLDELYGNSWREKQELILPKTEPRKNKCRPTAKNLSCSERRNPKKSLLYKNPYLDFDTDSAHLQKKANRIQIQRRVTPSPLLEKLKKLCDSDTTSDEDHKHLHKQKLNFDDAPDGRTSKYFAEIEANPEITPEVDEFDVPDWGKSLEERIKKKMNNIHIDDKLKLKTVNHRKNRLKDSEKKLNPLKAVNRTEMLNLDGVLRKHEVNEISTEKNKTSSSDKLILEVEKSVIKNKKLLHDDESYSSESTSDRKGVQRKNKKVNQYYESSGTNSEASDRRVQKDVGRPSSGEDSKITNKRENKSRSRSTSSLESDTKPEIDNRVQKDIKKSNKKVTPRRSSTSSSGNETNSKIDRVKKDDFKKPTVNSKTNSDGDNEVTRKKKNMFLDVSSASDESDDDFDEKVKRIHRSSLAQGKYSFLESLSGSVPLYSCDFKARMYRNNYKNLRAELATELFKLYNKKIFENKIPEDTPLQWNDRLRGTAGFCYCRKITRSNGNIERLVRIELASKVLDSPDRLRDTLVHEMCHAATWIINCVSDGHGYFWKSWAYKAMSTFPELPPIKRCHDYVLNTKYTYKCTQCGYSIGRHTKSLDTERKRCGHCYGKFEVLINKVSKKGDSKSVPATPKKEATGFALFVKENYGIHRTPDRKHGDVMRILGKKFQEMKVKK